MSCFRYCPSRRGWPAKKIVILSSFIALIILRTYRRREQELLTLENSSQETAFRCQMRKRVVYKDGERHCLNSTRYLSYQPPGGGWNNQRIAFENAIILAWLLERTLIVQPLAPHDQMLRYMTRDKLSAGYTVYNMLNARELVPISKIIDIKRLSLWLPVKEISSSHENFVEEYSQTFSWFNICRNGLTDAWIDELPDGLNKSRKNINMIMKATNVAKATDVPPHRRVCISKKATSGGGVWEFLKDLRKRKEQIIYFEKGSLFVRKLFFTNQHRALNAQRAIIGYVRPAPDIVWHVKEIIRAIGQPFNAIHVRRRNHKTGRSLPIQFWLSELAERKALRYSKGLYVASDEINSTWFNPLTEAGYRLYFANDFEMLRRIAKNNPVTGKDITGIHEQIICSLARIFIPSYYSTFSWTIERMREGRHWNGKKFRVFKHSSVKWLNIPSVLTD